MESTLRVVVLFFANIGTFFAYSNINNLTKGPHWDHYLKKKKKQNPNSCDLEEIIEEHVSTLFGVSSYLVLYGTWISQHSTMDK